MEPNTAYGFQQEINTDNVMQRMEVEMVPNTAYGFQQEINTDNVMQRMEVEMVPNTAYGFQQPSEGTADGTPIYDYIDQ